MVMCLDRLIGASWVSVCVALCVKPVPKVKGEREEKKKMTVGKAEENVIQSRQSEKKRLEINNKERLKNNILIKIEFFDVGGIVKWYGISNKVAF